MTKTFKERASARSAGLTPFGVIRRGILMSSHETESEAEKAAAYEAPCLGKGVVVDRRKGGPVSRVLP